MKRIPFLIILICAVVASIGGYYLVPSDEEQLAMLTRDGFGEVALERANKILASKDADPEMLMQIFLLNGHAGEKATALKAFRRYFRHRPDDAAAWRRAAELFEQTEQSELLKESLENLVRLTQDVEHIDRLSTIYRLEAKHDDEMRVLRLVKPDELPQGQSLRLAKLFIDAGDLPAGISILEAIETEGGDLPGEARIQLFVALVDVGRVDQAADKASAWRKEHEESAAAEYAATQNAPEHSAMEGVFIGYLLHAGAEKAALKLAMEKNDYTEITRYANIVNVFHYESRFDLVELWTHQWLSHVPDVPAERHDAHFRAMIDLGRGKGLTLTFFSQFFDELRTKHPVEVQASFVQAMYENFGYAGVAAYRHRLSDRIFAARPVLAALLMVDEKNSLAARHFLLATHLPAVSTNAQFQWLRAAELILSPQELGSEFARRARAGAIPTEVQRAVLDIMLKDRLQPHISVVWQAFFDDSKLPPIASRVH